MDQPGVISVALPATSPLRIAELARELPGDVRVVMLRIGTGPQRSDRWSSDLTVQLSSWLRSPDLVSVAVLAATPSPALLALALGCDIRICADDVVFGAGSGIEPGVVSGIAELVGRGVAASIVLGGQALTAQVALRAGLVEQVCRPDGVDAAVAALVDAILSIPRDTAAERKALLSRHRGGGGRSAFAGDLAAEIDARERLATGVELGAG